MDILKQQVKKYTFLLAGIYLISNLLAIVIVMMFPHILEIQYAPSSYRIYSMNDLIFLLELICNQVVVLLMYRDMKKIGEIVWPLLVLTFFYPVYSIIFYILVVFENTFNLKER